MNLFDMNASYELHTGHELELMKLHRKPLSMFYMDAEEDNPEEFFPKTAFDREVDSGLLRFSDFVVDRDLSRTLGRTLHVKFFLYSLADEAWRIEAMKLTLHIRNILTMYDEGLERLIGSLLGYSDAENDEFQKHIHASLAKRSS